jgi:hypothetical protein
MIPIMNTLAITVQTNFIDLLLLWAYIELTHRILYHVSEIKLNYFIYVENIRVKLFDNAMNLKKLYVSFKLMIINAYQQ